MSRIPVAGAPTGMNEARQEIESQFQVLMSMRAAGAFDQTYCNSSGENPPWILMPPFGRRLSFFGSIALPAEQVETDVTTFNVPQGYDGVISQHFHLFIPSAGGQFTEGSGELTWRIRQNTRPVRGYNAMLTTQGGLQSPLVMDAGGIRIQSSQSLRYTVTLAAGSLANLQAGRIHCGFIGWFYPRS
jgi:hypothetical protein